MGGYDLGLGLLLLFYIFLYVWVWVSLGKDLGRIIENENELGFESCTP